jgi:hypothetical protein
VRTKPDQLKQIVESRHGAPAELAQSVYIHERQQGMTVWEGVVHTFDLDRAQSSKRIYAWCSRRGDGTVEFVTVVHAGRAIDPLEALRTTLASEAGEYLPDMQRSWLAA